MHTINGPYTDLLPLLQSNCTDRTDRQSVLSVRISLSILDMGGRSTWVNLVIFTSWDPYDSWFIYNGLDTLVGLVIFADLDINPI